MREIEYLPDPNPRKRWWVVFIPDDGQPRPWWLKLLTTPEFRHCLLLGEAGEGTILVDSIWCRIRCVYQPISILEATTACATMGFRVVRVDEADGWGQKFEGLSCVGVLKSVLGIRSWLVWTPRQLYSYLIRRGCKRIC